MTQDRVIKGLASIANRGGLDAKVAREAIWYIETLDTAAKSLAQDLIMAHKELK